MSIKTLIAGAALALVAATPAFAEGFQPVLGMSLTGGGKTLLKVDMEGGGSQRISSGGLIHLFGGFEYRAPQSPVSFQATVGYHVDDIGADNGDASFSRVPFELLGFFHVADNVRLGGGVRKATSAEFHSSGAAEVGDFKMSTSLGFILQGEYLFGEHTSVFLRYVHEDYKSPVLQGGEVSGDHAGLGVSYRF